MKDAYLRHSPIAFAYGTGYNGYYVRLSFLSFRYTHTLRLDSSLVCAI